MKQINLAAGAGMSEPLCIEACAGGRSKRDQHIAVGSRRLTRSAGSTPRRAKLLTEENIAAVLEHIAMTDAVPESGRVKFLLSVRTGLRVSEIASLPVSAILDANGKVGKSIVVAARHSKSRRARAIPMHPQLREAIEIFLAEHPNAETFAFSRRWYTLKRQTMPAVKAWFSRIYAEVGLFGCSSHSGRRTFITNLARIANQHNRSLCDVQALAGHAQLNTTSAYIDRSEDLTELVAALGTDSAKGEPS